MLKMKDIADAIGHLKQYETLTSNGHDMYVLKKERIFCYDGGTRFSLTVEEFADLYKKKDFFLYKEEALIDEDKDEAYYRYYRK